MPHPHRRRRGPKPDRRRALGGRAEKLGKHGAARVRALRQDQRDKRLKVGLGYRLTGPYLLEGWIRFEVLSEFGLDDLLIGFHVDGLQARRTPIVAKAGHFFRDVDDLRRRGLSAATLAMVHDLTQRHSHLFKRLHGYVVPELIRLDALYDFRLFAHGIEVHL
jgi:hypothetical protein